MRTLPEACRSSSLSILIDPQLPSVLETLHQVALFVDEDPGRERELMEVLADFRSLGTSLARGDPLRADYFSEPILKLLEQILHRPEDLSRLLEVPLVHPAPLFI